MSSVTGGCAALRSGSGTCASVSLMVQSSGLVTGRDVASDKFIDLGFDGLALQHDAAVRPFDFAVAGGDFRLGQDHETALEAALLGQQLHTLMGGVVHGLNAPQ